MEKTLCTNSLLWQKTSAQGTLEGTDSRFGSQEAEQGVPREGQEWKEPKSGSWLSFPESAKAKLESPSSLKGMDTGRHEGLVCALSRIEGLGVQPGGLLAGVIWTFLGSLLLSVVWSPVSTLLLVYFNPYDLQLGAKVTFLKCIFAGKVTPWLKTS